MNLWIVDSPRPSDITTTVSQQSLRFKNDCRVYLPLIMSSCFYDRQLLVRCIIRPARLFGSKQYELYIPSFLKNFDYTSKNFGCKSIFLDEYFFHIFRTTQRQKLSRAAFLTHFRQNGVYDICCRKHRYDMINFVLR